MLISILVYVDHPSCSVLPHLNTCREVEEEQEELKNYLSGKFLLIYFKFVLLISSLSHSWPPLYTKCHQDDSSNQEIILLPLHTNGSFTSPQEEFLSVVVAPFHYYFSIEIKSQIRASACGTRYYRSVRRLRQPPRPKTCTAASEAVESLSQEPKK